MPGRYVERMNRGRRTDRVVYVLKEWDLPKPLWQLDAKFNVADELLRDPEFKPVLKRRSKKVPRSSSRSTGGTSDTIELGLKAKK
jgi:hypothetical protein